MVRLSGTAVWNIARTCFSSDALPVSIARGRWLGAIRLPEWTSPLPAELLAWPAPRTYTGQELLELHTLSSPCLIEMLVAHFLKVGARAARPGEFTLRAFLAGKLDLTRAEAVLGVIEATDPDDLKTALAQLAGNLAGPLHVLRDELLSLLAEVEAGLDFADEDLQFISRSDLLGRLSKVQAELQSLQQRLGDRSVSGRPFRVVLVGPPNAGKSSLFNALTGGEHALVSVEPGTTRDYLIRRLEIEGVAIDLVDTAGRQELAQEVAQEIAQEIAPLADPCTDVDEQAQRRRAEQSAAADLLLVCQDVLDASHDEPRTTTAAELRVSTKCDLLSEPLPSQVAGAVWPRTSPLTGAGLDELRSELVERARAVRRGPALAPSWSRCRHHLEAALAQIANAERIARLAEPPEILALELRLVLEQVGEMAGATYTDDLLDRIFGQFCIGK